MGGSVESGIESCLKLALLKEIYSIRLFGSRLDAGTHLFEMKDVSLWRSSFAQLRGRRR